MVTRQHERKQFAIAVSFPGEHRRFVRNVVNRLAEELGPGRIFFDEWYEGELAGVDGDLKLRRYYRDESEMVVPFFSKHYKKDWCGIEWSAIRSILKERREEGNVIPVEMDGTRIEGWEPVDFAIRRRNRTGKQIAEVILQAYRQYKPPDPAKPETSLGTPDEAGARTEEVQPTTEHLLKIRQPEAAKVLQSITVDIPHIRELFRRHLPEGMNDAPAEWSAFACAETLGRCHSQEPAMAFLGEVAARYADEDQARKIHEIFPAIAAQPGPPSQPSQPICLVLIEPPKGDENPDRDAHDVTIYRWWGQRNAELATTFACSSRELQKRIPEKLKEALNELGLKGIRPRAVEVVLPFELMLEDEVSCVERWPIPRRRLSGKRAQGAVSLGQRYPVALRCLDRWEDGELWLQIRDRMNEQEGVIARLRNGGFGSGENPYENEKVVGVVADRMLTEEELDAVVFAGVPVLLWLREPDPHGGAIEELHDIVSDDLTSIHDRVCERRRAERDHVGRCMALLGEIERRELPNTAPLAIHRNSEDTRNE